jgi:hypothetical protein
MRMIGVRSVVFIVTRSVSEGQTDALAYASGYDGKGISILFIKRTQNPKFVGFAGFSVGKRRE